MTTRPVCQFSYCALPPRALVAVREVVQHRLDVDRIPGRS
jgi:hypothetical protein